MTMIISLILLILLTWTIWTVNPVKLSMTVLIVGLSMLFSMSQSSGLMWFPLLMLMLFMGGVILMFMILSSVLPNEKSMKTKNQFLFVPIIFFLILFVENMFNNTSSGVESKSFLSSATNFYMMVSIILLYFVGSMSTLSSTQHPMRTYACCQTINFVN